VQDIWVEIDAVRPTHGASNQLDRCFGESHVVVDSCEHPGKRSGEVEFPHETIGKRHAQHAGAEMLDIGHSGESAHVYTLLERLDPAQRGGHLRQRPVRHEFVVMQRSPLLDKPRMGRDGL
jgi:hypothetical protein